MSKEVVLPSGAFANIREVTLLDLLTARVNTKHASSELPLMYCNASLIDGEPLTFEKFCAMDLRDYLALVKAFEEYFSGPIKTVKTDEGG